MRKIIVLLALSASCRLTHNEAMELRYSGVVALAGGTLTAAAPAFNGDSLARNTTAAGIGLDIVGVGLIVWSIASDPGVAPDVRRDGCAR